MKIGICTQPLGLNYGGIIQNYALQEVLRRRGHDVLTLDIGRYRWVDWLNSFWRICLHKLLGHKVQYPLTPAQRDSLEFPLRKFVNRHIGTTKPRTKWYADCMIKKYGFDAIVVGSDQTWRPRYNYKIQDQFLEFIKTNQILRISYAASFGTDSWEFTDEQTRICAKLLRKFKAVSVREESGVELCKKKMGVSAVHVLDPTLLLSSHDYMELCKSIPLKEGFVFAYILDMDSKKVNDIKEFALNKKLPYLIMSAGNDINSEDSIEKWLSFFRDARYVITDSFHGTAFSINFNTDFFVYCNTIRGNSRFLSLLKIFSLEDRIISSKISSNPIDINWNNVNDILLGERNRCLNWLYSQLEK